MAILTNRFGAPIRFSRGLLTPAGSGGGGGSFTSLSLIDFVTSYAPVQPVVQRSAGLTTGQVPVLFGFAGGTPTSIQARVVKASDGTTVFDWTALSGLTLGSVTGRGYLDGVPQGKGYLLQVRDGVTQPTSGALFSTGTVPWGVGVVILAQGQSNMVQTLAGNYQAVVPGTSLEEIDYYAANIPGSFYDNNGWHGQGVNDGSQGPGGGDSSTNTNGGNPQMFVRIVAGALLARYGYEVPIALIPMAYNQTLIEAFIDPRVGYASGTAYADLFGASGTTLGNFGLASPSNVYAGDFEAVAFHQGEANSGDAVAVYIAKLQALYQTYLNYVAQFGRTPANLVFAPAILGNYAVTGEPAIENIRIAEAQFVQQANAGTLTGQTTPWPAVQVGWTTIDLWRGTGTVGVNPPSDDLHFEIPAIQQRSMRRVIQTVLHSIGASGNGPSGQPFSGAGPSLAGTFTLSGLTATFDVTFTGGTTLAPPASGNPITGWYANTAADFSGTDIAITVALASSGTKVAVTFPTGTTFPAYVKHLGGLIGSTVVDSGGYTASCYPNISNILYDNCSYPTGCTGTDIDALGLPLLPSVGALTVQSAAAATTWSVGSARTYPTLSALLAANVAAPGDVVQFDDGTYTDPNTIPIPLTLTSRTGMAGAVTFDNAGAGNLAGGGKAMMLLHAPCTISGIAFTNIGLGGAAGVAQQGQGAGNQAAIRCENFAALATVTLNSCSFDGCVTGVFGVDPNVNMVINTSDFGRTLSNGQSQDGFSHDEYTQVNSTTHNNCNFYGNTYANNLKSRSLTTICNGGYSRNGAGRCIDIPQGGAYSVTGGRYDAGGVSENIFAYAEESTANGVQGGTISGITLNVGVAGATVWNDASGTTMAFTGVTQGWFGTGTIGVGLIGPGTITGLSASGAATASSLPAPPAAASMSSLVGVAPFGFPQNAPTVTVASASLSNATIDPNAPKNAEVGLVRIAVTPGVTAVDATGQYLANAVYADAAGTSSYFTLHPYTGGIRTTQANVPAGTYTVKGTIAASNLATPYPFAVTVTVPSTPTGAVVWAPSLLQPSAAGDLVGLRFSAINAARNSGNAALASKIVSFGHSFGLGVVHTTDHLQWKPSGTAVPVQMDVRSLHTDGSVRFAQLTMAAPALAASAFVDGMLQTGAPTPGAALTFASMTGYASTVTINHYEVVNPGGFINDGLTGQTVFTRTGSPTVYTFDVAAALATALAAGTLAYWQQGPLCTSARLTLKPFGIMRLMIDVGKKSDGTFWTDVIFCNSLCTVLPANGDYNAQTKAIPDDMDVTISHVGATTYTVTNLQQYPYQGWHKQLWSDGEWVGNIIYDVTYLTKPLAAGGSAAVHPYDLPMGALASNLSSCSVQAAIASPPWRTPLNPNNVDQQMGGTGLRQDIGQLPTMGVHWVMTQDASAVEYMTGWAEAEHSVTWHCWDDTHHCWMNNASSGNTNFSNQGNPGLWYAAPLYTNNYSKIGWELDFSHSPQLAYVGYLVKGSNYFYDRLIGEGVSVVAAVVVADNVPNSAFHAEAPVRGKSWVGRDAFLANWMAVPGTPDATYLALVAETTWATALSSMQLWIPQQGDCKGWISGTYGTAGSIATWMQSYYFHMLGLEVLRGDASAKTMMDYMLNCVIGSATYQDGGWNPRNSSSYNLYVGNNLTDVFAGQPAEPYGTYDEWQTGAVGIGQDNGVSWVSANSTDAMAICASLALAIQIYDTADPATAQAAKHIMAWYRSSDLTVGSAMYTASQQQLTYGPYAVPF